MQNTKLKELKDDLKDGLIQSDSENVTTSGAKPLRSSEVELGKSDIKSGDGFNLLGAVLEVAFLFTLFEYIADRQFDSRRRSLRIGRMRLMHPILYKVCIFFDFSVRGITALAIVGFAIFAAYKAMR